MCSKLRKLLAHARVSDWLCKRRSDWKGAAAEMIPQLTIKFGRLVKSKAEGTGCSFPRIMIFIYQNDAQPTRRIQGNLSFKYKNVSTQRENDFKKTKKQKTEGDTLCVWPRRNDGSFSHVSLSKSFQTIMCLVDLLLSGEATVTDTTGARWPVDSYVNSRLALWLLASLH